ncbi:MAG: lipoate protein ligase C-terminal domain-containing protein [Nitrososphaerota archaeon]
MQAELKVHGGKLIRVACSVKGSKLDSVKITGDFFLHPEDDLEGLEEELKGIEIDEDRIRKAVRSFFERRGTTIIGAGPDDFADVIIKALRG